VDAGLCRRRHFRPHSTRLPTYRRRNPISTSTDTLTTMQLVGWEDISMLKGYNIIDQARLRQGVAKLNAYLDQQKKKPSRLVAIRG
jgi:hypothetical protein